MSKLSEAIVELGFSEKVAMSVDAAFSSRNEVVKNLLSVDSDRDSKKRIHILGDFAVSMIKACLASTLEPATSSKNVKDYEVIVSVVSTIIFEVVFMTTMIADGDREKIERTLRPILQTCIDESENIYEELKNSTDFGDEENDTGRFRNLH